MITFIVYWFCADSLMLVFEILWMKMYFCVLGHHFLICWISIEDSWQKKKKNINRRWMLSDSMLIIDDSFFFIKNSYSFHMNCLDRFNMHPYFCLRICILFTTTYKNNLLKIMTKIISSKNKIFIKSFSVEFRVLFFFLKQSSEFFQDGRI